MVMMDKNECSQEAEQISMCSSKTLYVREKLSLYSIRSFIFSQWKDWRIEVV